MAEQEHSELKHLAVLSICWIYRCNAQSPERQQTRVVHCRLRQPLALPGNGPSVTLSQ